MTINRFEPIYIKINLPTVHRNCNKQWVEFFANGSADSMRKPKNRPSTNCTNVFFSE